MSFLALRTFAKPAGSVSNDKRFKKKNLDSVRIFMECNADLTSVTSAFLSRKAEIYVAWFLKDEGGRFFNPVLTKVAFSSSPNYLLYVF
tara:strand:- start:76 stop:342 length:267 start_codon:yes stop_codon:yes gene_type:complete